MSLPAPGSLAERIAKYLANPADFPLEFTAWLRRFLDEPSNFTYAGIREITSVDGTIKIVDPFGPVTDLSHLLPPWFDYRWTSSSTQVTIDNPGGVSTNPTTTAAIAIAMIQTLDGEQIPPYGAGVPVEDGTAIGELNVILNAAGTKSGSSTGEYFIPVFYRINGSSSGGHGQTIGSGWIKDASTNATFTAHLVSQGGNASIYVPNIPDLSPPSGGVRNMVRIDWPFPWASTDTLYNGTFMYSMETAG